MKKRTGTVNYWAKLASGTIITYTEAEAYQIEAAYKAGLIVPLSEEEWRQIVMRGKPNENQLK